MVSQRKVIVVSAVGIILVVAIIIAVLFAKRDSNTVAPPTEETYKANVYKKAAVATDAKVCSKIGVDILRRNGTAADAAVATVFCIGVANPQSCGIGGGAFMIYYQRTSKTFTVYDFREEAPGSSFETMFVNQSQKSVYGGKAVGIPGEVKGLWKLHQNYGRLNWSELIEPSIKLARDGITVTVPIFKAIESVKTRTQLSAGLRKILTKPDGKTFLQVGDILKNPELAETLETIQKNPESFYNGSLRDKIIEDLNGEGGNISVVDFLNYSVKERSTIKLQLPDGRSLHTMSAPGSGAIVAMIHNIMSGYNLSQIDLKKSDDQLKYYQWITEAMKFSYAQRGLLGDPDFVPSENITNVYNITTNLTIGELISKNKIKLNETYNPSYYGGFWGKDDFGTSHVSILAENGDAISITSTINYLFGNLFRSNVTGIIYNNEMDDFSTPGSSNLYGYPPTPANYIRPGKRPLSSMSPSIVTDKNGDVKMVAGASGGSMIISGTAQVMLKSLFLGVELGEAVASYRLHHQGIPNEITYNANYPPPMDLIARLKTIGHKVVETTSMSVVQAIYKDRDNIFAMSDPRKYSEADGY